MLRSRNSRLARTGIAVLASLCIGGCTTVPQAPRAAIERGAELPPGMVAAESAERSLGRIAIGKSTTADVAAALGRAAAVLAFDSGFEVWVYRIMPAQAAKQSEGELVVLFAPSGMLAKKQLRVASRAE